MQLTARDIARMVRGELSGNPDQVVTGLAGLREATPNDVSFLASPKYQAAAKTTHARVLIVAKDLPVDFDGSVIRVDNPSEAFAELVRQVAPPPVTFPTGIHPTAVVASTARLGQDVSVQPHAVIEDRVVVGDRTVIGAGAYIGHESRVGVDCRFYANISLRERTIVGDRVILHSGVVLGADGFGYEPVNGTHKKIPQVGNVEIGDDVEIGANSAIDRGAVRPDADRQRHQDRQSGADWPQLRDWRALHHLRVGGHRRQHDYRQPCDPGRTGRDCGASDHRGQEHHHGASRGDQGRSSRLDHAGRAGGSPQRIQANERGHPTVAGNTRQVSRSEIAARREQWRHGRWCDRLALSTVTPRAECDRLPRVLLAKLRAGVTIRVMAPCVLKWIGAMIRPDKFTIKGQEALQSAQEIAQKLNHPEVDTEHLLSALIQQPDGLVRPLLDKLGTNPDTILRSLDDALNRRSQVHGADASQLSMSKGLRAALEAAFTQADKLKDQFVGTEHMLLGLAETTNLLKPHGVTPAAILKALREVRGNTRVTDQNPEDKYQALTKYGRDLTEDARRGKLDPVIGRDTEIRRVIQVLSRRTKNNPVLIGDPGVGKTAIAEGLARRIVSGDVPEGLKGKRLISMDIGSMLAGAKYRGEFEDRFKAFLKEVIASEGNIIVFIDELHTRGGRGQGRGRAGGRGEHAQAVTGPR